MDESTMIMLAVVAAPAWAVVNIAVAKYALQMFFSQQDLQTVETTTPPKQV